MDPKKWNELINDKGVTAIDVRKPFEYKVGTFIGSINPKINSFREFPKIFKQIKKKIKKLPCFAPVEYVVKKLLIS